MSNFLIVCFLFLSVLLLSSPVFVSSSLRGGSSIRSRSSKNNNNDKNKILVGGCSCQPTRVNSLLRKEAEAQALQKETNELDNTPGMGLLQPLNFLEIRAPARCNVLCKIKKSASSFGSKILSSEGDNPENKENNAAVAAKENVDTLPDTEEQLVDSAGVEDALVVKKGHVSTRMEKLGKMSSYTYANEQVEDKEEAWYLFWEKDKLTEQDKVIHGVNYIEKQMKTSDGVFSETEYVDRELSNREATVFVNKELNEVIVAFKGTNFASGQDLAADYALFDNMAIKKAVEISLEMLSTVIGEESAKAGTDYIQKNGEREIREVLEITTNVIAKYPGMKVVTTGHSLGGAKALFAARHFNLEATAFNPGPLGVNEKPCAACTIVRTEDDVISVESKQYADVVLSQQDGWVPWKDALEESDGKGLIKTMKALVKLGVKNIKNTPSQLGNYLSAHTNHPGKELIPTIEVDTSETTKPKPRRRRRKSTTDTDLLQVSTKKNRRPTKFMTIIYKNI